MPFSPVAVTLVGFIAAVASLTGVYLVQCSLARRPARARIKTA